MSFFRKVMSIALMLCLLPVGTMMLSAWLAQHNGCMLTDSSPSPCIVMGFDAGGILVALHGFGRLMLQTIPAGAALVLLWLVTELVRLVRGR